MATYTRRTVLASAIGGAAAMMLAACTADETTTDGTAATGSTATPTTTTVAVPAYDLLEVPAAPDFTFAEGLDGDVAGSAAVTAVFLLAKTLVTNAEYAAFVAATGADAPGYWQDGAVPDGQEDHPVLSVSAEAAEAFCAWLTGGTDGYAFRLPTEGEWEFAATGGDRRTYPWGEDGPSYEDGVLTAKLTFNGLISSVALAEHADDLVTYVDESDQAGQQVVLSSILSMSSGGRVTGWIDHDTKTGFCYTDLYQELTVDGGYTTAVTAHQDGAGPYGHLDMAGNAYEWTSSDIVSTNGAEAGTTVRAVRGGSWYANLSSCKTSYRGEGRAASGGYSSVGFRVAADRG
ncbi:MAG: SUMF1/EgtB/PvdO family nonheme iron enzyme [Microbacterium sp.]